KIGAIAGEPLTGFITAQSLRGRSKLLEHLGRRDAPERRRRLIHTGYGNLHGHFRKCCRTLARIWGAVILSAASIPTMRVARPSLARRFLSSCLASPGPKSR